MLVKRYLSNVSAVLFVMLTAASAAAQGTHGVHFGLSGTAIFPTEEARRDFATGWGGSAMVIFNPPISPVGVRAEGTYIGMESNSSRGVTRVRIASGTANVVVSPRRLLATPYFIGGVGAYGLSFTSSSRAAPYSGDQTKLGWNAGGGIAVPLGTKSSLFVEARYHSVQADTGRFTFVPVSVGVVF